MRSDARHNRSNSISVLLVLVFFLAVIAQNPAQASDPSLETHESLDQAVRQYLRPKLQTLEASRINLEVGKVDPRLKLQKCPEPLEMEQLGNKSLSGKVNIRIRCRAASWGIFVPVKIQIFEPVVVSRVTLPRGTVVSRELLAVREVESSSLNYSFFRSIDQVAGTETVRPIQANGIVFSNMVQAADTVRKGDEVIIKAQVGGLSVRIKGLALQDGAMGEQIQVRNVQSRRIIRAVITGPGSVRVAL